MSLEDCSSSVPDDGNYGNDGNDHDEHYSMGHHSKGSFSEIHSHILGTSEQEFEFWDQKTITFNVGGKIFQTHASSLRASPENTGIKLFNTVFMGQHWHKEHEWYFFDRDHECFDSVLNYICSGSLHLPRNLCSPMIAMELLYWGIPRFQIEACCWREFSSGLTSLELVQELERDRLPVYTDPNRVFISYSVNMAHSVATKIWQLITDQDTRNGKIYFYIYQTSVLMSIALFACTTEPAFSDPQITNCSINTEQCVIKTLHNLYVFNFQKMDIMSWVYLFDLILVMLFALELLVIILVCPSPKQYLLSSNGIIEIIALIPDAFSLLILVIIEREGIEANHVFDHVQISNSFRSIRFIRMFRLLRFIRRTPYLMIIVYSIWASVGDIIAGCAFVFSAAAFFATVLYLLEDEPTFENIPIGIWWGIITMCTVGYGDVYPVSGAGRIIGILCALCGLLVLGISAPTLVHNFLIYFNLFRYIGKKEADYLEPLNKSRSKTMNVRRGSLVFVR